MRWLLYYLPITLFAFAFLLFTSNSSHECCKDTAYVKALALCDHFFHLHTAAAFYKKVCILKVLLCKPLCRF